MTEREVGNAALTNTGSIGNINTGAGDDTIVMGCAFTGAIDGGSGTNTPSVTGGTRPRRSPSALSRTSTATPRAAAMRRSRKARRFRPSR